MRNTPTSAPSLPPPPEAILPQTTADVANMAGSRVGFIGQTLTGLGILGIMGAGILTILGKPPNIVKKFIPGGSNS